MSSYNHTIGFKVLIDSEVVDFTFRVPRGTLLIQILDELETTLRIQPRVVAIINEKGEVVIIENHYSPIDYLVQKHGTEFYAGESSFITFNSGAYVVDLEVPEVIPFAATYRTACKSFELKTKEVGIERQDGQVMDYEVFSLPTAFVLNSWGNYYRIVGRDEGDPYIEPIREEMPEQEETQKPFAEMVYPPKLDGSDIVDVGKELIDATPIESEEEAEVDRLTRQFVDASIDKPELEETDDLTEFAVIDSRDDSSTEEQIEESTEFTEEKPSYPWSQEVKEPSDDTDIETIDETVDSESLESLMDEITIDDESIEKSDDEFVTEETDYESIPPIQEIASKPSETDDSIKESIVEQVFKGILAEEKEEESLRKQSFDEIDEDDDYFDFPEDDEEEEEIITDKVETIESGELSPPVTEEISKVPEEVMEYFGEEETFESEEIPLESVSSEEHSEIIEEEAESLIEIDDEETVDDDFGAEKISDLPDVISDDSIESTIEEEEYLPVNDLDDEIEIEKPIVEESSTETLEVIEEEQPPVQIPVTTPIEEKVQPPIEIIKEQLEKEEAGQEESELSLDERLDIRKKELDSLKETIDEELSTSKPLNQRTVTLDYYSKMYPQKIYPLTVKIPPSIKKNSNDLTEVKIEPILPGCLITPQLEIVDLTNETEIEVEFNVTPLIRRGSINGKIGLWSHRRNMLTINTTSKVVTPFWIGFSAIISILSAIFVVLGFTIDFNTRVSNFLGNSGLSNYFLGAELAVSILFLLLMILLIIVKRPHKNSFTRKFYPIVPNKDE